MSNTEFELGGVCHLAVVCEDMERTVDFYTNTLGMKLAKTVAIPGGQHFFFDMGGGQYIAFFWFQDAPPRSPGIASPADVPGIGRDIATAHGSMNHVSFKVPAEKIEEYKAKLEAKGVRTGPILNHDDSERGISPEVNEGTYVRSVYFFDPDGILLEFAAWTRELRPDDVAHLPFDKFGVPAQADQGSTR
ncbi:VOC family protein [Nocardia sp. SYP-A9097]|uniref:VOC family protein n=1 Tax=Nocardia sp. SYP-A9097 TaxID=2663237 RepID=UPI00129A111C|nr:VOC family protein [Nocardia sp. SYP-A9097]MRH91774.1 VOC family protein [Nocardia sp. SYP-A9097]